MTAAKLIMTEIRKNKYGTSAYPKTMDIQQATEFLSFWQRSSMF